jgi:aryl-alcohol dehydrogenase-like predicted oxidoreductase
MQYKELGKSGIKVSAIGLGAWQWGRREWGWGRTYGKKDVMEAFQKAIDLGINFIDTAELYGRGRSEELVGEAIRGHREDVVIATKVWPLNLSYGQVLRAAERSRRRLGVDVIDLYQIHWPNPIIPMRSTMKAMKKLVQDGRVRCVGVSNFNLKRMRNAKEALAPLELASNQVKYNLLQRGPEVEVLPYAQKERISIIAYSPLAQGLLSGKYDINTRPSSFIQKVNYRFSTQNLRRLVQFNRTITEVAQAHSKTPSQVSLNWLIEKNSVIAIPGTKNADHVASSAGAADWKLTTTDIEKLENAAGELSFSRLSAIPNLLRITTK